MPIVTGMGMRNNMKFLTRAVAPFRKMPLQDGIFLKEATALVRSF